MRYLWRVKIDGLWYVGAYYKFLPYTPCPVGYKDNQDNYKHVLIQTESSDWNMPRSIIGVDIPKNCLDTLGQCTGLKDKNGILIFKCQDKVSSGKQYLSHIFIINEAVELGFYPKDLFVLIAKTRLVADWQKNQKHSRKFHSYFLVFEKNNKKIKYI